MPWLMGFLDTQLFSGFPISCRQLTFLLLNFSSQFIALSVVFSSGCQPIAGRRPRVCPAAAAGRRGKLLQAHHFANSVVQVCVFFWSKWIDSHYFPPTAGLPTCFGSNPFLILSSTNLINSWPVIF